MDFLIFIAFIFFAFSTAMNMDFLMFIALLFCAWSTAMNIKFDSEDAIEQKIEKNLRNECLEYQHTQDDQVICIKRLSEEQINQILDR